ncbi:MAG: hypothetical protein AAGA02_11885 [Bacteroidota bacterium]
MDKSNYDIDVLGFKLNYPQSWPGALTGILALLILSILAFSIIYFVLSRENLQEKVFSLITGVYTQSTDEIELKDNNGRILFWTPSLNTKQSILKFYEGKSIAETDKWQLNVTQGKIDTFGIEARKRFFHGWRYNEVRGYGSTFMKEGLWWSATLRSDFDIDKFIEFYYQHWGESERIYFEFIGINSQRIGD